MQRVTSFVLATLILASAVVSAIFVLQAIRTEQSDTSSISSLDENEPITEEEVSSEEQLQQEPAENMLQGSQLTNFTPTTERLTELRIEDLTVGTGDEVVAGATVTAHYTGALVSSGVIFQSSKDTGSEFTAPLSNLIVGWQKGIPGMKVGGVRRITIPASEAYGSVERPGIPADSDLVFDIELSATK